MSTEPTQRRVLYPPRTVSNEVTREHYIWLRELVRAINTLEDPPYALALKESLDEAIAALNNAHGIKSVYAESLQEDATTTKLIDIGENYRKGSTEFYWDRRRLIPKVEATQNAGFYDYIEMENTDGTYRTLLMRSGPKKGSKLVIWYTPDV